MLSGFFVSHGQEMFGIIAATWIPYILYFFIRLQQDMKWDDAVETFVFHVSATYGWLPGADDHAVLFAADYFSCPGY
jgi:hypothetical protein